MAAPNIIPMADIMLVLLIIFMVVTPMLQKGMSVEMAKVNNPVGHAQCRQGRRDHRRHLARAATSIWATPRLTSRQIADQVRDRISNKLDKTVFIKSDGRAKYGDVVKVVDEVRSAGVDNVGLLTDQAEEKRRRSPPPPATRFGREAWHFGSASRFRLCTIVRPRRNTTVAHEFESGSYDNGNGRWRKKGRFDGDDERRAADRYSPGADDHLHGDHAVDAERSGCAGAAAGAAEPEAADRCRRRRRSSFRCWTTEN